MPLHRLLYRSQIAILGSNDVVQDEVLRIIEQAQTNNRMSGISGAILLVEDTFVQVLEGPLANVEATFERICRDQRHRQLRLIDFTPAEERALPEWSMASITPQGDIVPILHTLSAIEESRQDPMNAAATIGLMRSLVLASSAPKAEVNVANARTSFVA